ncbi:putative nuclease HARBI1 [Uloborus diversus]|uniref:putative nuclease HARBI1 n=1 Tax=Uloborus diversus TaxID=327109 RepID=UPI002408F606|nr:putative nuclease HARBI1 [Uloborus diversus]
MPPVKKRRLDPQEERYNKKHAKTRNPIERCFGVLKSRFRYLIQDRKLHHHPVVAARIVNACAVLHNMCILHDIEDPDDISSEITEREIQDSIGDDDADDDDDDYLSTPPDANGYATQQRLISMLGNI